MTRNPGVVVQVIARSSKLWSEEADKAALRERTSFVAGDFFKSGALHVCLRQRLTMSALPASLKTCRSLTGACALRFSVASVQPLSSWLRCHVCDRCACLMQLSTCKCVQTVDRLNLINCKRAGSSAFYSRHIID